MPPTAAGSLYTRPFERESPAGTCCTLWVMDADGSDPHEFIPSTGETWDGQPTVSPDGSKVAFWNGHVAVRRADGTGSVVETGPKPPGTIHWVWSPDSSKILMYPNDTSNTSAYLLDPDGGPWTTVPWQQDGDLDWQRPRPDHCRVRAGRPDRERGRSLRRGRPRRAAQGVVAPPTPLGP